MPSSIRVACIYNDVQQPNRSINVDLPCDGGNIRWRPSCDCASALCAQNATTAIESSKYGQMVRALSRGGIYTSWQRPDILILTLMA